MTAQSYLRTAGAPILAQAIREQRESTWLALHGITGKQWLGSCLETVNPPLWEIGHVGWFQERWCVRESSKRSVTEALKDPTHGGVRPSLLKDADRLYHSNLVAHSTRWDLSLLEPDAVRHYLDQVLEAALQRLEGLPSDSPELYFHRLALFHEMMHRESFCYTWQTLGYAPPSDLGEPLPLAPRRWLPVPPGIVVLGSHADHGFVFDNEKWATEQPVEAFEITNRVVSNGDFAEFVRAGGYDQAEFWAPDVWKQLQVAGRKCPAHWRLDKDSIQVRRFDRWVEMEESLPLTHVSLFEAEAWCRWAGCQLPTETQWLHAAQQPGFEWGAVWEWTASEFEPFEGFSEDPYEEYSSPWFHTHQVLKGASFATPAGMRDLRFRNYYEPERDDLFNGFRVVRSRP